MSALLKNGAEMDVRNSMQVTALYMAAQVAFHPFHYGVKRMQENHEDVVRLLLESGADPTVATGMPNL